MNDKVMHSNYRTIIDNDPVILSAIVEAVEVELHE